MSETKCLVKEFTDRLKNIEEEIATLNDDRKELIKEFAEKLDMKTLKTAIQVLKIEASVKHRDTFDEYRNILEETT